jgi:hypothetical protein
MQHLPLVRAGGHNHPYLSPGSGSPADNPPRRDARYLWRLTVTCKSSARHTLLPHGVRSAQAQGHDHRRDPGIIEANEQLILAPFPCHRHPASDHPLRDLPAHRRLPARRPQRSANRALPSSPPRSARPFRPVSPAGLPPTRNGFSAQGFNNRAGWLRGDCDRAWVDPDFYRGAWAAGR